MTTEVSMQTILAFGLILAALQAPALPPGIKPANESAAPTGASAPVSQGAAPITYKDDLTQIVDTGSDTDERDVSVTLGGDTLTVTPKKGPATAVAYASIGSMTYDRRSRVRKMAPTYGKRLQHFLTIQFKYPDGRGDFVELEMGKDVAPRLVAQLEARSGKTITRSGG
jgi:hypothetical protein